MTETVVKTKVTSWGISALFCLATLTALTACSQLGSDPDTAAAIELPALPYPSIVIGDSLRDANGVASPVRAIVRNLNGDEIQDAGVVYVYAEFNRDSALQVDESTGHVFATKAPKGESRIAARVGVALQVLRPLIVTIRPDSLTRDGVPDVSELVTSLPDTSSSSARANTSGALTVGVRHVNEEGETEAVRGWIVRYTLISPSNPNNDSTAAVFLVNSSGRASVIDTTESDGTASRSVRVRAAQFPAGTEPDSVVIDVSASARGTPLRGSPVRVVLPVRRGTPAGE